MEDLCFKEVSSMQDLENNNYINYFRSIRKY